MRISDWSSDVCSSDLLRGRRQLRGGIGADPGAEREAHQDQWALRQALAQPVGEKYRVLGLATALIMQAFAATDAAEVEAQHVQQTGRATRRARVCQYVSISGVAVRLKKKKKKQ